MTNFRVKKMDDFYTLIGSGKIVLDKKFMEKLLPFEPSEKKKEPLLKKSVPKVIKKTESAIQVKGIKLANCCSPIRGEPITGYITSGKGITVHSLRCPLVSREILKYDRMFEVTWEDIPAGSYKGKLLIKSEDSPGVLATLTSAIAQLEGNITKAEVKTFEDMKAKIKLTLVIRDLKHFEAIMKKISAIKQIASVERI